MKRLISLILVLALGLFVVGYGVVASNSAVSTLNFNLGEFISITITDGDTVSFGTNLDPTGCYTMDDGTTLAIKSNIGIGNAQQWEITGSKNVVAMPKGAIQATVKDALDWGFGSMPGQVLDGSGSQSDITIGYELCPTVDMPSGDYIMSVTFTVTKK